MAEEIDIDTLNVKDFFAGQTIFITGVTGFLGKALIEKLLRSCVDLKEIYVLIRPKKGMSIEERLKKMFSILLYEKLREMNPSAFDKVIPINGDLREKGLGLDPADRQMLIDRVSIIFHNGASVRFDDSLRDAIFMNTRSTRDICILAESMKKLKVLCHVSSTYANCDKPVVEEIYYPFNVDWKKTIEIAETIDNHLLKTLTSKYIGSVPNTYIFSKRLAEAVVNDYSSRIPCTVTRLSIVIASLDDPIPGWMDNFNGPVGMMIGGGKGILKSTYTKPDIVMDYIPVDVAIKGIILGTCKRGRIPITRDSSMHVYNIASCKFMSISMKEMIDMALKINEVVPLANCIWWPHSTITTCYYNFYINTLIYQLIPALIIDKMLTFAGHKPLLTKLQKSIFIASVSLKHFMFNGWDFPNNKMVKLLSRLSGPDMDFYINFNDVKLTEFMTDAILGAKIHLLREDVNRIEDARRHQRRMYWVDWVFKIFWFFIFVWILSRYGFFPDLF